MRTTRYGLRFYRYPIDELCLEDAARTSRPRINQYYGRYPISGWWAIGDWVYCVKWARA